MLRMSAIVAVHKPKKSKRASSRGVTKRGSLVEDDTFSPPKLSIDNDGSDNVVESSDMPQEPRDSATNVPNVAAGQSVPLDEMFGYDCISWTSVQSVQENELEPPTSTSDRAQRLTDDMDFVHSTEPSKRRKLDMKDLMLRTHVTKRAGLGKPFGQFKAPKRPEITRLPPFDGTETGPHTTVKALEKGSADPLLLTYFGCGKTNRNLANEKDRAQLLAAVVAQEADFAKRLERVDSLTKANVSSTQTIFLLEY